MLKNLLQEVWRSVRPKPPEAPTVATPPPAPSEAFTGATRAERMRLIEQLSAQLQQQPEDLDGWTRLGDWCLAMERFRDAEQAYRCGLAMRPMHLAAQEGLGLALLKLQQNNEAYLRLETVCKSDPGRSDAWVHWGLADLAMGNYEQAAMKFQSAIDRDPKNPHAWQNLGLVAYHLGQLKACIDAIREAIALRPGDGMAHANLALALRQRGEPDQALEAAQKATKLKPESPRVWVVLADTLFDQADFTACGRAIQHALALDAGFVPAHVAQGKLLTAQRDWAGARASFERCLALQPGHADAEGGIAILELLLEQWPTAWDWHEARRRTQPAPVRSLPYPEWDGQGRPGETVLVHAEQGLGDIILFSSCLPDLQSTGTRCVVEVPARLEKLFARSFPDCLVVGNESNRGGLAWLDRIPTPERQVPVGSLPRWFRRQPPSFPMHGGYLRPDPQRVEHWRERLTEELPGNGLVVGLAWRGGLATTAHRHRSLRLSDLLTALEGVSARWVNLQYGDVEAELAACSAHPAGPVHPGLSGYADLDDLAALTSACDVVLTVCSTQAHLTGALGRPGLVLVPMHPNWRYGLEGERSVWYPSLRLLRQTEAEHWQGPLEVVRRAIEAWPVRGAADARGHA